MTCRIERLIANEGSVIFRVSGQIEGDDVRMLQELLATTTGAVGLDLKEVTLVDRSAVTLLALYERSGLKLRNLPAYVREWVKKEQAQIRRNKVDGDDDDAGKVR